MRRTLFLVGSLLLLTTAALWLAGTLGPVATAIDDQWSQLTLKGGMIALAAALLLRMLAPLFGRLAKGRCEACGRLTERGHMFCLDHLQETVNATRDRTREQKNPRPKVQPQARS